ncbi:protein translocase subunit SecD [Bowmanella sp. JS7-9]|uniref:Protein translocase subunit SecD n=1 Tax=Pseudobowmanella zhangzhouensis TaxID=1537679 RepID=A0ABW1XKI7_9ALTE|nr:protein translocase subunit SecD [Bowmanella sp. JS7-9]TBX20624.1 preprotein translocase subunit SecD [Bowmanella sp. JS7-9]
MLNKTPLWKTLMVILVIAVAGLYALPNIYGEDHAVQISPDRNAVIDSTVLLNAEQALADAGIKIKGSKFDADSKQILIRLENPDQQNQARETIAAELGNKFIVANNLAPDTPEWLKALGGEPLKLGLDLRGGVHFLMEVDMNTVLKDNLQSLRDELRRSLRIEKIRYRTVEVEGNSVSVLFRDADMLSLAESFIKRTKPDVVVSESGELTLKVVFSELSLKETRDNAVKQNITIMRNRVNQLGVAEPLIQRQGPDRIVVQLPGIQDTAYAKQILNATATLEFRLVDTEHDVRDALNGRVPPGSILIDNDKTGRPELLVDTIALKGSHIVDARAGVDENGRPQVNIKLDSEGGAQITAFSRENVRKPMATVFIEYKPLPERDENDKPVFEKIQRVISVATIQTTLGQAFRITGLDSPGEAHNLALLLRAGALIAPIQIVEERTVGPSLGKENIELGQTAILYGLVLVLAFMLFYYKKFGLVANAALLANLILIIGVMGLIPGATLTLPGMAGIVLTVGMAVDANVLIFERIREELREGRGPQQAIHHGYDSAFSTILDANITTLIAAVILFGIGTGPIKGFSITLAIGIITSMFTAIVVTRVIVNNVWGGKRVTKLSV